MNIYIGNLPLDLTEDELRTEFLIFGQVKSVNMMNDRDISSGQQCGYGFVEMALQTEGIAAVSGLKDKTIRGRTIEVIESLCFTGHADGKSIDSRRGSHFNRIKQRNSRKKLNRLP